MRALAADGEDINQQNYFGNTPLHYACDNGKSNAVIVAYNLTRVCAGCLCTARALITEFGADLHARDQVPIL